MDGDVYAGCQKITIEGQVTEDVLAGCQELSIRGKVGDMVSGCAQSILIDGEVGGDVRLLNGHISREIYMSVQVISDWKAAVLMVGFVGWR